MSQDFKIFANNENNNIFPTKFNTAKLPSNSIIINAENKGNDDDSLDFVMVDSSAKGHSLAPANIIHINKNVFNVVNNILELNTFKNAFKNEYSILNAVAKDFYGKSFDDLVLADIQNNNFHIDKPLKFINANGTAGIKEHLLDKHYKHYECKEINTIKLQYSINTIAYTKDNAGFIINDDGEYEVVDKYDITFKDIYGDSGVSSEYITVRGYDKDKKEIEGYNTDEFKSAIANAINKFYNDTILIENICKATNCPQTYEFGETLNLNTEITSIELESGQTYEISCTEAKINYDIYFGIGFVFNINDGKSDVDIIMSGSSQKTNDVQISISSTHGECPSFRREGNNLYSFNSSIGEIITLNENFDAYFDELGSTVIERLDNAHEFELEKIQDEDNNPVEHTYLSISKNYIKCKKLFTSNFKDTEWNTYIDPDKTIQKTQFLCTDSTDSSNILKLYRDKSKYTLKWTLNVDDINNYIETNLYPINDSKINRWVRCVGGIANDGNENLKINLLPIIVSIDTNKTDKYKKGSFEFARQYKDNKFTYKLLASPSTGGSPDYMLEFPYKINNDKNFGGYINQSYDGTTWTYNNDDFKMYWLTNAKYTDPEKNTAYNVYMYFDTIYINTTTNTIMFKNSYRPQNGDITPYGCYYKNTDNKFIGITDNKNISDSTIILNNSLSLKFSKLDPNQNSLSVPSETTDNPNTYNYYPIYYICLNTHLKLTGTPTYTGNTDTTCNKYEWDTSSDFN